MPNAVELSKLGKLVEAPVIELVKRNKDFTPVDLRKVIKMGVARSSNYRDEDVQEAVSLIEQCLKWVPDDRITAEGALKHPFLLS